MDRKRKPLDAESLRVESFETARPDDQPSHGREAAYGISIVFTECPRACTEALSCDCYAI